MADVAARNIAPLVVGVFIEGLKYADILLHFGQRLPLSLHGRLVLCRLLRVLAPWLCLQLKNLPSQDLGVSSVATDAGLDLVESTLESMESGKSNVLGRCASALEFVVDGGILAENVAVANAENLGAGGTMLSLVFVKEQRDATLSISGLPLCGSDGHAECSSEQATDIVGGVSVVGDAQKVWTRELLHGSLVPFDHHTLDSIGLKKSEDPRRSVVCVLSGGGSGMGRNPNHDGTNSVLLVLAAGDETSCLDGRIANLPSFQELADLGSDSVPDSVEQCVEDSIDGLGREMRVSALGDGEGIFEEIRAVEEVGMVGGDTVVVRGSLPVRDSVGGDSGAIRGDGECREVRGCLAQCRGDKGLAMARVVDTLEREQRQV